jgi:DNA-binding CsgD family transcriptional regulator
MDCTGGDRPVLSQGAVDAFALIAAGIPVPEEDAEAVTELITWGFVVIDTEHENRPVALDPDDIARRLLEQELREANRRVQKMTVLPSITQQLAGPFQRAKLRAGGGSEYISDVAVVNARLDDVVGSAEWEILAAQPGGPRTEVQLNRSVERDTAALDRGVAKRTLYRATVRDNAVTCQYARAMTARPAGKSAEFRTLVGPFERAIIVDRRVAFISNHLVAGAPEHAAWQVTDPGVIAYMVAEFDAKWRRADPWHGELARRGGEGVDTVSGPGAVRTSPRQREILRDIVVGRAQQATAQRLGISLRTLGVEIAELKSLFDAESLPELAFRWALSPDRLVDDTDHTTDAGAAGAEDEEAAA